jgi:hypothetical protein
MKKSWTAFYIDKYQSHYFYDTVNYKMYKCSNDFKIPTWIMYVTLFLSAVLSDFLNRLFMPPKNLSVSCLFVAIALAIGYTAFYLLMRYINKMIDSMVYELRASPEQMDEYIEKGRKNFKRDIVIISITMSVSMIILLLSVWLFFVFDSIHILIVTALVWMLILLCGFSFQPIKRNKLYRNGTTGIKNNE